MVIFTAQQANAGQIIQQTTLNKLKRALDKQINDFIFLGLNSLSNLQMMGYHAQFSIKAPLSLSLFGPSFATPPPPPSPLIHLSYPFPSSPLPFFFIYLPSLSPPITPLLSLFPPSLLPFSSLSLFYLFLKPPFSYLISLHQKLSILIL